METLKQSYNELKGDKFREVSELEDKLLAARNSIRWLLKELLKYRDDDEIKVMLELLNV